MKVQHKVRPVETYEVLEESPNYYIIKGNSTFVHVASKADYEPVQEWVDVTHECQLVWKNDSYMVYHDGTWLWQTSKYRISNLHNLAKVKVEVKR